MNEKTRLAAKIASVATNLLGDPRAIPLYLSTLRRQPLEVGLPWISLKAIRFLERYLSAEMVVFEYGSGGSTIFFAQRCRRVIAVEDNFEWANAVQNRLDQLGLMNVDLQLREAGSIYTSTSAEFRRSSYLHAVDELNPDIVFIDGADELCPYGRNDYEPRRVICFRHVEPRITRSGAVIILDDASLYTELHINGAREVVPFYGVGPCRMGVTRTDFFMY